MLDIFTYVLKEFMKNGIKEIRCVIYNYIMWLVIILFF